MTTKLIRENISSGWQSVKFGEIAEVIMGQSPAGSSYNKKGHGKPLINGPTEFTDLYPITIQWTSAPTKICHKGDVLLCVRGSSTGRINISDDEYCIGRGVAAIRATEKTSQDYLRQQINLIVEKVLGLTSGSTFPNIDSKSIKNIALPLPPLPEQNRIVSVLETWDKSIEKLTQKIEAKKQIKKGLMQDLLTGKKRLGGFKDIWKHFKINEICKTSSGGTPRVINETYYINGTIPWLNSGEVRKGKIRTFDNFITEVGLKNSSAKIFPVGTVLVAMYGATAGQIGFLEQEASTNQAICGLLPNKKYHSDFLYYLLLTKTAELLSLGSGAAQPNISQEIIRDFDLFIPSSVAEQIAISKIISVADKEIIELQKKLYIIKEQKRYLLNNLITGTIRTPETLSVKS